MTLSLCALLLASSSAVAQDPAPPLRRIDVSGSGSVQAPLDVALVTMGAEAEAPETAAAQKEVDRKVSAVLAALERLRIKPPDVRTVSYQVSPKVEYRPDKGPKKEGYRVACSLEAKVKDLKQLGRVFDAVLAAGADTVSGSSFGIAEREKFESEARRKAVADARRRAEELARELGARVGEPLAVSEDYTAVFPPPPMPMAFAMERAGGGAFPTAPGETEVRVTVRVTFALLPGKE
jgi:uncharacterized protein YggE